MIKIIPFAPSHVEQMTLKECHRDEITGSLPPQTAFTMLVDEKPIAIVGWYFVRPGVLHTWSLLTDEIRKHTLSFHRNVKNLIAFAFWKTKAQRIQLSVRCEYAEGQRWARALGFSCEGIMKQYGPNRSDYYLFSRCS